MMSLFACLVAKVGFGSRNGVRSGSPKVLTDILTPPVCSGGTRRPSAPTPPPHLRRWQGRATPGPGDKRPPGRQGDLRACAARERAGVRVIHIFRDSECPVTAPQSAGTCWAILFR